MEKYLSQTFKRHPTYKYIITMSGTKCPVCMEVIEFEDNAGLLCKHDLHLSCVLELHSPTCPVCRARLESDKLCDEDLEKMKLKHNEDVAYIDEETYVDDDDDLEEEREVFQNAHYLDIGLAFKEKAKDFLNEIRFEEFLRLRHTPVDRKLINEAKFRAYLRLYDGVDDIETRCKFFKLMDEGEQEIISFLQSKTLAVEKDFLSEICYQAYLMDFVEEDTFDTRCEMMSLGDVMQFVRYLFTI